MSVTPTQRSMKLMRDRGYHVEVVEKWNSFTKTKKDLFGFIDVLCISEGSVVGVQSTSYTNVAARVTKIREHELYPVVLSSGIQILVHGWHKKGRFWEVRELDIRESVI